MGIKIDSSSSEFGDSDNHIYNIDAYFKKLIEGKKVIYVGPSPILEGREMGELIDSFDVIVRSNACYPIPENLKKDYGSKCDILYINWYFNKIFNQKYQIYNDLKLICSKNSSVNHPRNRVFKVKKTKYLEDKKIHLTGSHTFLDIIEKNPDIFHITGISFYLEKKHHHHNFSYLNLNNSKKNLIKYHNIDSEINFFLNEILNKENVKIDDFLLELLRENNYIK